MKNKVYYILLGLLVSFSFINNVFADGLEFKMTATADNNEIVLGEQGTITVNLQSDSAISSCQFAIDTDTSVEFVSKSGLNNWNFGADESTIITINNNSSDSVAYTEGKNIFNLVYKINGNGKVTIKDIQCVSSSTSEDGSTADITGTVENMEVSFTAKEIVDDTTLSSLTVVGGKLLAEFSPNNYEYVIELEKPSFSLDMVASNTDYNDKIVVTDSNGNVLDPKNITFSNDGAQGLMHMTITVNGNTSKQYVLIAHYKQEELDNSLSFLKINGIEIRLSEDKVDYTFEVADNVNEVNIDAILKDSNNFQFREGNEPGVFKVSNGTTSIALMIVPKNSQIGGEAKTYTIEIIKKGSSSVNNGTSNNNGTDNNAGSSNNNTITNPSTGNISMFVMAIILISSLVGSIFLYKKNLESYK